MKKIIFITCFIILTTVLFSCNQNQQNDMVKNEINKRTSFLVDSLNTVCTENYNKILEGTVASAINKIKKDAKSKPATGGKSKGKGVLNNRSGVKTKPNTNSAGKKVNQNPSKISKKGKGVFNRPGMKKKKE